MLSRKFSNKSTFDRKIAFITFRMLHWSLTGNFERSILIEFVSNLSLKIGKM